MANFCPGGDGGDLTVGSPDLNGCYSVSGNCAALIPELATAFNTQGFAQICPNNSPFSVTVGGNVNLVVAGGPPCSIGGLTSFSVDQTQSPPKFCATATGAITCLGGDGRTVCF